MKCMHCHKEFDEIEVFTDLGCVAYYNNPNKEDDAWDCLDIYDALCPHCNGSHLYYSVTIGSSGSIELIWPLTNRPPCPPEVPAYIQDDYREACLVLTVSPKASAALSRRCLQNMLRDVAKVKPSDLANEIQEVIDRGQLPSRLVESIDAIRNIGNFAAHPSKSKNTGQFVNVTVEDAEWNLGVLESLFDFYYVQPALVAKKRAALNVKLQEAGKPPMK